MLADVLQSLIVCLLAFVVQQLLDFLQGAKSERVGTVSIQLDRLRVDAQCFVEMPVDEEVVTFEAQLELLKMTRWNQVHAFSLLNYFYRNLLFAQRLLIG